MMSGEEVIGDITSKDDIHIVKNAVSIVYQQTEKGLGAGLAPYMPYVEGDVEIRDHAIASFGVPGKEMYNQYNRIFGSGIQIAGVDEIPL